MIYLTKRNWYHLLFTLLRHAEKAVQYSIVSSCIHQAVMNHDAATCPPFGLKPDCHVFVSRSARSASVCKIVWSKFSVLVAYSGLDMLRDSRWKAEG